MENTDMQMKLKQAFTLHPFLFSIFPILFIFAMNSQEIKFNELILPFSIVLSLTFVIVLALGIVFKNKKAVGFIVSIGFLLFFSYGHIHDLISNNFEVRHFVLESVFVVFFIITVFYFAKTKRKLNNSIKIANTIGIVLIAISAMNIISDNIQGNYSIDFLDTSENIISTTVISDKPDVYYIVLDAYAGDYALKNYFGYENNEFLSFLTENNFYVVPDAKTNYGTTFLSLASSLNIQHHNCLEDANFCVGTGRAFEMIQNNKVMKKFNEEGYTIINSYSGWTPTRDFDIAYSNLCGRYSATINSELTITIIGKSMLNPIYVKLFEDVKRDQVLCVFSELEEVQHSYEKPIFVFSHMVLPHHPYVFGANGEDVSPETLEIGWEGLEDDKEGYLNQLKFTNKKIQHFITKVIDESEIPPIIIIQGDHGLKSEMEDLQNPTDEELKERFSILNAYYIPTKIELLEQNITPVNSFRIIINELFNEQLEMLPNTNYWTVPDPPYIKEVTQILQENKTN